MGNKAGIDQAEFWLTNMQKGNQVQKFFKGRHEEIFTNSFSRRGK